MRIALTLKPDIINWSDLICFMTNPPVCFHPQKRVYLINMNSKMWLYVSFKSFLDTNNRTTHISTAANECVCLCVMFYNRKSLCRCHQTSQQLLIIYTQNLFQICLKKICISQTDIVFFIHSAFRCLKQQRNTQSSSFQPRLFYY